MATTNITQLRRVVFRKWDKTGESWSVFTLEPDDLGQDSTCTFNIAPRIKSRASALGTAETPIPGTYDAFAASVTFIADTWEILGRALNKWTASTYAGAGAGDGQILGDDSSICAGGEYYSVILQGVCDTGSSADIEFTRCQPSVDDDIEIGNSDAAEITLNLHPILYNAKTHAGDGYPEYSYRLGDESTTTQERLNASTGEYAPVTSDSEG